MNRARGLMRVLVVTMGKRTAEVIRNELETLLGSVMRFEYLSLEEPVDVMLHADLVVVSSMFVVERIARQIMPGTHLLILRRTLSPTGWKLARELPENSRVLVVNDTRNSSVETVALLYELGAKHLELMPWYPGMDTVPSAHMVLTPNEASLNPLPELPCVNVGDRVLDPGSMVEMLSQLDLLTADTVPLVLHHMQRSVPRNPGLLRLLCAFKGSEQALFALLDDLPDGVLLFDAHDTLLMGNKAAARLARELGLELPGARLRDLLGRTDASEATPQAALQACLAVGGRLYSLTCQLFGAAGGIWKGAVLVRRQAEASRQQAAWSGMAHGHTAKYSFEHLIGQSERLREARDLALRFARSEGAVLVEGESGTGKELFAHGIHKSSSRGHMPFIAFNCAAVPDTLIESELFGHEEGAFTGARRGGRAGLFELANGGSLFLDEVGDISPSMQTRLLRVIQEREVVRVGGRTVTSVNVRLICATNRPLAQLVEQGHFRADLYYRLNVLLLRVPSLRERASDIPLLISHFFQHHGIKRDIPRVVMERLLAYPWPGNVRELENCVTHMASLGQATHTLDDLPESLRQQPQPRQAHATAFSVRATDAPRPADAAALAPDMAALLAVIARLNRLGLRPGRQRLAEAMREDGWHLSPAAIRCRLEALCRAGHIQQGRGRHGCVALHVE